MRCRFGNLRYGRLGGLRYDSSANAFVQALAGVFAVVFVEFFCELLAVLFVFDGLDEHFGWKPGLLEDMVAGADVNALLEF